MTKAGKRLIKAAKEARGELTRVDDAMSVHSRRCEKANKPYGPGANYNATRLGSRIEENSRD